MSDSNVSEFYEKYPFLESVVPKEKASNVSVEHFDISFARESYVTYEPMYLTPIYLLNAEGEYMDHVGHIPNRSHGWRLALNILSSSLVALFTKPPRKELVFQALERMREQADRVHYAVHILDDTGFLTSSVVLYKLPHGFKNAGQWYRSIKLDNRRRPIEVGLPVTA